MDTCDHRCNIPESEVLKSDTFHSSRFVLFEDWLERLSDLEADQVLQVRPPLQLEGIVQPVHPLDIWRRKPVGNLPQYFKNALPIRFLHRFVGLVLAQVALQESAAHFRTAKPGNLFPGTSEYFFPVAFFTSQ